MALIEFQIERTHFELLVWFVVSSAPIPVPTIDVLGSDRLISGISWSSMEISSAPPDIIVPIGTGMAKGRITIQHVSIAELDANPSVVHQQISGTAWVLLSTSPISLRMTATVVRLDLDGKAPSPTLRLDFGNLPIGSSGGGLTFVGSALAFSDTVVAIRLATASTDDLFSIPANNIPDNDHWSLGISGGIFVDTVLGMLTGSVSPPPAGTVIEDQPSANWQQLDNGQWGVYAQVGIKKINACPTLFGSVDLSVTINVEFWIALPSTFTTSTAQQFGTTLILQSDVSDWDVFRCWAGSAGLANLLLDQFIPPFLRLPIAIGTLIATGEIFRLQAGSAITGISVGDNLTKVSSDDTSATYSGSISLPIPGSSSGSGSASTLSAISLGPNGLVMAGQISIVAASHQVDFQPDHGNLSGHWSGHFNCKTGWHPVFTIQPVQITDNAVVLTKTVAQVPVTVFPTSTILPPGPFSLDLPSGSAIIQIVDLEAAGAGLKQTARAFLHTSAGIRRFELGPLPPAPMPPSDIQLAGLSFNCNHIAREWSPIMALHWRPDPPPIDLGLPAVRQWSIAIEQVQQNSRFTVLGVQGEHATGEKVSITSVKDGPMALEILTDSTTNLRLETSLHTAPRGSRLLQRWLLPLCAIQLPGPATALERVADSIAVLAGGRLLFVSFDGQIISDMDAKNISKIYSDGSSLIAYGSEGIFRIANGLVQRFEDQTVDCGPERSRTQIKSQISGARHATMPTSTSSSETKASAAPPFSLSLRNGRVAALYKQQLLIALPFGGLLP